MSKLFFNNAYIIHFNDLHQKYRCAKILFLFCIVFFVISITTYYSDRNVLKNKFRVLDNNSKNSFQEMKNQHLFPLSVSQFIQRVFESNITLVLIDPLLLFNLISSSDKEMLIRRKLVPQSFLSATDNNNLEIITFAITQTDALSFEQNFGGIINKIMKGGNGSNRHWNNTEELDNVSLHYLLNLNQICIHVTVLYSKNEIFWMGKISQQQLKIIKSQNITVSFGKFEQAFDKFSLEKKLISNNIVFYVPNETVHFISQIEFSRYIECDFNTARKFRSENAQKLIESKDFNKKMVLNAIIAMKALMKELILPFWIGSGTLLGWFRQCGVIPYTSDIDFITWSSYASKDITDRFINNNVGLKLRYIYGIIENGYQYAMYTKLSNFRVDLFYMYKEGNNLSFTGHIPSANSYFRYIYPYYTLCSAELIGLKVLVPCNAKRIIETEYGPNWTKPKTSWSYVSSPFNAGPRKKWTNEEKNKITYKQLY